MAERGDGITNQPQDGAIGDAELAEVERTLVDLHERYHGRKPTTTRTQMMGEDMLACMLGEVYTDIEKTLIEMQRQALVRETRSVFQAVMEHRFVAAVESATGRRVRQFISSHHVGPDLELELFVLEPAAN